MRASCLPTAVLPEPIGPIRKTFLRRACELMTAGPTINESGRPKAAADSSGQDARSVQARALAQDARRHEDQQLVLVVGLRGRLEQVTQDRNVAEPRHFPLGVAAL